MKNDISKLMQIDSSLAVRLLIDNAGSLSAKNILSQLSKYPEMQVCRLHSALLFLPLVSFLFISLCFCKGSGELMIDGKFFSFKVGVFCLV